jgi:hypothetical protein
VTLSDPACAALLAQIMSAADGGAAVIKARSRGHSMSNEGQAEFFLRKFAKHENVERAAVFKLMEEFNKCVVVMPGQPQCSRCLQPRPPRNHAPAARRPRLTPPRPHRRPHARTAAPPPPLLGSTS